MNGVMQTIAFLMMFAVLKLYPLLVLHFGIENVWIVYTIICVIGVLFSIYILPETKGIPIDEILKRFESPKKISQITSSANCSINPINKNTEIVNP